MCAPYDGFWDALDIAEKRGDVDTLKTMLKQLGQPGGYYSDGYRRRELRDAIDRVKVKAKAAKAAAEAAEKKALDVVADLVAEKATEQVKVADPIKV